MANIISDKSLDLIEKKPLDFTIAIPTYNGATRLPKLLDSLLQQTEVEHLKWEIIIIDNNSADNTAEIIRNYQAKWNCDFPLRYVQEKQQGLAFARTRAVNEARGESIGFLDDDNLPAPDWVKEAHAFGRQNPQAGAWSGQIHGQYEVEPPENFQRIQAFLAVREHGDKPFLFNPDILKLPPGAALVVRKKAWSENVPLQLVFKGRLGNSMLGGDDYEAIIYLHKAGWLICYNPAMHVYHQISSCRLQKDYLLNLAKGCGLCHCQLRLTNAKGWRKIIIFFKIFLSNLHRLIKQIIKYRFNLKVISSHFLKENFIFTV